MKLFTIGYQAVTQGQVIERLKAAGVQVLIDVRAVAASRRAGFSKKLLAAGRASGLPRRPHGGDAGDLQRLSG